MLGPEAQIGFDPASHRWAAGCAALLAVDSLALMHGCCRCTVDELDSKSYPGLPCRYELHHVDVHVSGLPETETFVTREQRGSGWLENHWTWVDAESVQ